ncbi:hypothetical protein V5P93_003120 [Actinokineospora auranticolor]|uniref:hypothetical protein n=1 Tax=Actinokineospora auranticolor TaxID=155976 RepID=UPI0011AFEC35|nr:hypothetical protein [Actinokineospora auranticolor]
MSEPPTTTQAPTTTTTTTAAAEGPAAVVTAYFDAINAKDYRRAWELGGKNTGRSYDQFAAGFAQTDLDVLTVVGVEGNVVTVDLVAVQTDGTKRSFHGTYTVSGDTITDSKIKATG